MYCGAVAFGAAHRGEIIEDLGRLIGITIGARGRTCRWRIGAGFVLFSRVRRLRACVCRLSAPGRSGCIGQASDTVAPALGGVVAKVAPVATFGSVRRGWSGIYGDDGADGKDPVVDGRAKLMPGGVGGEVGQVGWRRGSSRP